MARALASCLIFALATAAGAARPKAPASKAAAAPAPSPRPEGSAAAAAAQPPVDAAQPALDPLPPPPELPADDGPVLPLAQALHDARLNSVDLAVARERVVQAQNTVSRAWSALKPTLTANGQYLRNDTTGEINLGPQFGTVTTQALNLVTANLTGAITLFNGRSFPALATAHDQVDVAGFNESQTRRELLLNVAALYLTGVQQKELSKAAFQHAASVRSQALQAQARYEAGVLQKSAAVRARLDVVTADEQARASVFAYASTRSSLSALLDRHDVAYELAAPAEGPPELKGAFPDLLQKALQDRPEMAAARINEQIAQRLTTDAWAQFLPTLNLNGQYRYTNTPGFVPENFSWAITLALAIPLYDGGFRYVALKDASSQQRQTAAQTRGQGTRIEDELRRGQIDLASARTQVVQAEQALVFAKENQRLIRAQFDAGTSTQIEVTDAESSLFQAQANLVQQRLQVQLSSLRLARAVGAFDP